jgi:hypothetical protein
MRCRNCRLSDIKNIPMRMVVGFPQKRMRRVVVDLSQKGQKQNQKSRETINSDFRIK